MLFRSNKITSQDSTNHWIPFTEYEVDAKERFESNFMSKYIAGKLKSQLITTHENPTFIKNGVIHYCVPNIPSRYSKTASLSISNIITPFLIQIAEDGGIESALRCNKGLKNGVYLYHGILTNKAIGEWFNLPDSDINLIVF